MMKAVLFLSLASSLSITAHAYPAGCQTDRDGAYIQLGADSTERLSFSSKAVCEKQMAQLKANPSSVVCGCHSPASLGTLFSMLGGVSLKYKDVSCHTVTYSEELKSYSLTEVKIPGSPWPKAYEARDYKPKRFHTDSSLAGPEMVQDCVNDEAKYFDAMNASGGDKEIASGPVPADAGN